MNVLPIILLILLVLSLTLNYLYEIKDANSFEIVRDIGIGYNLGNTFDSYSYFIGEVGIKDPNDQITLNGNIIPTKYMINKIKRYGFKTIRFPVTWTNFIDELGNIDSNWMKLIKEVIDLIMNEKMYCILNIHHDGKYGNWLTKGMKYKDIYINLWTQIADTFKDYNEHLIFESMNELYYTDIETNGYNQEELLNLNQLFVNTIRNSENINKKRLLLIAGAYDDIEWTCSGDYKMPVDPYNKLAVSIHYYHPSDFTKNPYFEPWNWTDLTGYTVYFEPSLYWGNGDEYFKIFNDFELMKNTFLDQGIPIIIGEVGVLTEERKDIKAIREYLYTEFAMSSDYDGIMSCLWDTSNKNFGDMNYYDRNNDTWYDEKIKEIFLTISRKKHLSPKNFYIKTYFETCSIFNYDGFLYISIGSRKVKTIIINARLTGVLFVDTEFDVFTKTKNGKYIGIEFLKENGKKQYDGTSVFTIDARQLDCNEFIEITVSKGAKYITLNNLTLEFEKSFLSIDYKSYKNAISNYIY